MAKDMIFAVDTSEILNGAGMDASSKASPAVSKLLKVWETRQAQKAARAGGLGLMAVSLAACGGSDTSPFSQADIDELEDEIEELEAQIADLEAEIDDLEDENADLLAQIDDLEGDIDGLENPAGDVFVLTTSTSDVLIGVGTGDAFSGTTATDDATDIVLDSSTGDGDTFTLAVTANPAALTVVNVEAVSITSTMLAGSALTIDAANYRGVDVLSVTRSNVGQIDGTGAVTVQNIVGGRVLAVNSVSGVTSLVVEQQTLDGTVVNATGVTGDVTLHGAGTINAASSTGTITISDVDLGGTALAATGLDGASVINAALAATITVGAGAGVLSGSVTIDAAAATTVTVTTTGAVNISNGSTATAATTITVNDVDASGTTIVSGKTGTSSSASTITLEGTALATDTASVSAKGLVTFDVDGTAGQDVDLLTLSGNGAAVTYTFQAGNDFSSITLTGSESVTLVGDSDDFDGETVTDSTTAGTTTLRFNADSAANVDLSGVSVDVIDIDIANLDNVLNLADGQTLLVSEDQGTDDLEVTADAEGYSLTLQAGDDTLDTSLATITLGVAALTDFDTVNIVASDGAFSATSLDASSTSGTVAITITGNKAVTLGDILAAGEIASINAGALTGVLTLELQDGDLETLISGTAADVIEINAAALAGSINAGDGANNIDIDSADDGLSVTTGSGADNIEIADVDTFVISSGSGNDNINFAVDTDSIIDGGDGTDTLDINSNAALDLSDNGNFAFLNFEIVDIADANDTVTISAADFALENTFSLVGSSSADILKVSGTSSANTIDASGVEGDGNAVLQIDGGDGADTLIGSDDGTVFIISAVAHVDSGEIITGGTGTDTITYTGAAGTLDLSVATITGVEAVATGSATALVLAQGTGITTLTGIAATETLTLEKLSTSFESSEETAAGDVNIAGEWNLSDDGTDATLTYYDESLSLVVSLLLTGMDASTITALGGDLTVTYAT